MFISCHHSHSYSNQVLGTLCVNTKAYQIEVHKRMDWWVTPKEDFPVIVYVFHDRSKSDTEHRKVLEGLPVPVNFDLLSFRAAS